ncbi:MAG: DUF3842 family protein [Eubacteriales bacterium]
MKKKFTIAVVDGKGGGIGKTLVERINKEDLDAEILALGTNSAATSNMMKSGADQGATGENAIIYNAGKVDIIVGVLGLLISNSMLGEVSYKIAEAIGESQALKVLIPLEKCNVALTNSNNLSLKDNIDNAAKIIKKYIEKTEK